MTPARLSFVLCVLCAGLAGGQDAAPQGVPFEAAARAFMARSGLSEHGALDVEALLDERFVLARLGACDLHFPVTGLERNAAAFKDCAIALLASHEKFCDWTKPAGMDQKDLRADLKTLTDWVKSWRVPALAKTQDVGGKNVLALLGASENVAAASERLASRFRTGEVLGLARETPIAIRTVLEPTRKEFVEFACFLGLASPDERANYWVEGLAVWATFWIGEIQVIALEAPAAGRATGDYEAGESMNERDPTVMQQQVVQFSLQRLFRQLFGEALPEILVEGFSMNLVIDQFGEIGTRLDGDLRGRSTQDRAMFIPGVASDGFLPKDSAETRWREGRGRDRFVHVLRQSQKDGEGLDKSHKNHVAGFGVRSDSGGDHAGVRAPFLASPAEDAPAPAGPAAAFQGDYAELKRAYKCAFVCWLQSKAAGSEKTSREKFAQLLAKLADPAQEFEAVFPAVYEGVPLSDADAGQDSLEGRFLLWLSRQK